MTDTSGLLDGSEKLLAQQVFSHTLSEDYLDFVVKSSTPNYAKYASDASSVAIIVLRQAVGFVAELGEYYSALDVENASLEEITQELGDVLFWYGALQNTFTEFLAAGESHSFLPLQSNDVSTPMYFLGLFEKLTRKFDLEAFLKYALRLALLADELLTDALDAWEDRLGKDAPSLEELQALNRAKLEQRVEAQGRAV